jgi:hypothetical protein
MQANDDTISAYSGDIVELNLLANDEFTNIELDEVTLEIMASSLFGNMEKVGDNFVYRTQEDFTGVEHFSYVISTESGRIESVANVELTITDPRPVANDDFFSTNEGEAIDVDLLSNDFDLNDVVSPSNIIIRSSSENGTLSMRNSSTWRYTPSNGFVGTDRFTYVLTDGKGNSSESAKIVITVVGKETSSGGSIYYLICILLSALCLKRQQLY